MGKPSLFLARTPPRRLNSVRCYARIFELEAKHGLDVEPDVTALRTKVARLAAVASDESIRHLAPDLVTAAADARSDQDIELSRLAAVGEVQRLHRLDRDARQRAAPAGMRPGHDSPGAVEEEERKAVGVVSHDRLAGNIGGQGIGIEDALPAFRLPPMEGDDVGAVLLDGHQGTGEIEAQLVGELLAPLHHEVRIVR